MMNELAGYALDSGYSMGADIGDDVEAVLGDDYAVGAARRMPVLRRPQPQLARRAAPGYGQSVVRTREPTRSREYPLGFDSGAVPLAAGATADVFANPQVLFRPDRVVIPASLAPNFLINSLVVGKNLMFAAAGAISAETFVPGAFGVQLHCDTAQINSRINFNVTNISLAASRFLATMIGEAVE